MTIAGVGTDVVAVGRIARLIEHGDSRFLHRWFRPAEVEGLLAHKAPARHTAVQFAAKEAVLKALRVPDSGPVRWREIEITHGPDGAPGVVLHGTIRTLAEAGGIVGFQVALACDETIATATALALSAEGQSAS